MSSSYEIPTTFSDEELVKSFRKIYFMISKKIIRRAQRKVSTTNPLNTLIFQTTSYIPLNCLLWLVFMAHVLLKSTNGNLQLIKGAPRSVDMNFLNYEKYGSWLEDGLPASLSFYWEDSGQFITPMLTHSTAITGYQIRDNYRPVDRTVKNSWNIFEHIHKKLIGEFRSVYQVYSEIDLAFYKIHYKAKISLLYLME